jgi:alpha-D-xyloside xylohydrolase
MLQLTAQAENAIRVRCGNLTSPKLPELIFAAQSPNVAASVAFFRPGRTQFTDPAYHERFVRWLEFSTFSPLMRVHGYQTNTEPWHYGPEMVEQEKELIDLRYQLLPYIYSQAANVTSSGGTIMRPLVMDFSDDPRALDQKYEYMFGPAFLVAPVLEPGVSRAHVYAPHSKGGWFNWWTGQPIASGGGCAHWQDSSAGPGR